MTTIKRMHSQGPKKILPPRWGLCSQGSRVFWGPLMRPQCPAGELSLGAVFPVGPPLEGPLGAPLEGPWGPLKGPHPLVLLGFEVGRWDACC